MSDHDRNTRVHLPEKHARNEAVHSVDPAICLKPKGEEERCARNETVHHTDN